MGQPAPYISVPARWESIEHLLSFVDTLETHMELSEDQAYLLRLVVEEIATNIVKYSYDHHVDGMIELVCETGDGELRVIIRDHGRPFDPRDCPPPDMSENVMERSIGGLGIFLVREMCDTLSYQHDTSSGWNELVVIKKL